MDRWRLPTTAEIGGKEYPVRADYREVLDLLTILQDEAIPRQMQLRIVLPLFYDGFPAMPRKDWAEALQWMFQFINGGEEEVESRPFPKRIDWGQDQPLILADINRVAGCEIRALSFMHWWTFLSWFRAIGEGQLSLVVGIREKRRKGQKLEKWEQEFYREHQNEIDLKQRYTPEEEAERQRLLKLLGE